MHLHPIADTADGTRSNTSYLTRKGGLYTQVKCESDDKSESDDSRRQRSSLSLSLSIARA